MCITVLLKQGQRIFIARNAGEEIMPRATITPLSIQWQPYRRKVPGSPNASCSRHGESRCGPERHEELIVDSGEITLESPIICPRIHKLNLRATSYRPMERGVKVRICWTWDVDLASKVRCNKFGGEGGTSRGEPLSEAPKQRVRDSNLAREAKVKS